MMRTAGPPRFSQLALWSRRAALLAALLALAAVAGAQTKRLSAFEALTLLGGGLGLALVTLVLAGGGFAAIWRDGLRGVGAATLGALGALLVLVWPGYLLGRSLFLPPINDVSTDVATPPVIRDAISGVGEPLPYPAAFAAEQRAAYPAIQPLLIDVDQAEAAVICASALKSLGIAIVDERAGGPGEDGWIAAIDESRLLRFADDLTLRLRAVSPTETRIDIRSRSRIGGHDIGVNAARVERIADAITRLAEAQD